MDLCINSEEGGYGLYRSAVFHNYTRAGGSRTTRAAFAVAAYQLLGRTEIAYLIVDFGLLAVATLVAAFQTSVTNAEALLLIDTGLRAVSTALVAESFQSINLARRGSCSPNPNALPSMSSNSYSFALKRQ